MAISRQQASQLAQAFLDKLKQDGKLGDFTRDIMQALADQGILMETGFEAFHHALIPHAGEDQVNDMRIAYFAGATHLFMAQSFMFEATEESSAADERRMDSVAEELAEYSKQMEKGGYRLLYPKPAKDQS